MTAKDQVLLRTKDISIILLVCTMLGLIGTQFKKIYRWDETADKMEKLEARVSANERITIQISTQLDGISKQLDQVNWSLRRMGIHGRDS